MSYNDKNLDELYEYRDKLQDMLKYARVYGSVEIAGERITYARLNDELVNIKAEIASRISHSRPRLLK